jgi:hypothetical protein
MHAHPVLGGDHKEFFGSFQGCPAVLNKYMVQSLPQQRVGKGSRVREPPRGVQKLAAFSECSHRIAEQQQRCGKGDGRDAGCELCVLSLAEVAESSGAEERNSKFEMLARYFELAEVGRNHAEHEMGPATIVVAFAGSARPSTR